MQNDKKRKKSTKKPKTRRARGKTCARQVERQRKGEKKGAKEEEVGGAFLKERGANKGKILVQTRKKGRRMEREKRKAQIENEDEQREPRKTI